jgi:hypothetical protein
LLHFVSEFSQDPICLRTRPEGGPAPDKEIKRVFDLADRQRGQMEGAGAQEC